MMTRYTPDSAQGVILDVHFLSQCDFLVCTFSSQVCRLAYELMQTRFADASWRFRSLDDVYYFGGQTGHNVKAILEHEPNKKNNEIELKVGDLISKLYLLISTFSFALISNWIVFCYLKSIIGLHGNHWNGFSKGRNQRTHQEGLFPSYKVIDVKTQNNSD